MLLIRNKRGWRTQKIFSFQDLCAPCLAAHHVAYAKLSRQRNTEFQKGDTFHSLRLSIENHLSAVANISHVTVLRMIGVEAKICKEQWLAAWLRAATLGLNRDKDRIDL